MLSELQAHSDLISRVLYYQHQIRSTVEQFKAVVQLVDGSRLHINEVWVIDELSKYAYYWLTPTDDVIRGWDNAPHHPDVDTYPHHTHHSSKVLTSSVRSLKDVLFVLEQCIETSLQKDQNYANDNAMETL